MAAWESFGPVGAPHKNGDRIYGFTTGYAADLMAAGTPNVSSLYRASISDAIALVDVGDVLDVELEGQFWWVRREGQVVGRLTWATPLKGQPDPRTGVPLWPDSQGVLEVQRVFVNAGRVVNVGGIFRPS